jgi:hypothetical protein
VESEIDYKEHTESELVDMFGRLDPRYAPAECARLGKYQLLDDGLRKDDPKLIATAGQDLKQIEQAAKVRRGAGQ